MQSVKIVDAFTFYNEIDLLNYRLNLLDDVVDHFVIVEATRTFKGEEKPLFFQMHKQKFAKFLPKIIHVVVDDLVFRPIVKPNEIINRDNGYWKNEKHQRNCIKRGIEQLNLKKHDYIIISDVDEIPNPELLQKIKQLREHERFECCTFAQILHHYNLNSVVMSKFMKGPHLWMHSKIISYDCFATKCNLMAQHCRENKLNDNIIMNGGWHLTYFGSPEFIINKIKQFSHQEVNTPEKTTIEYVKHCIKNQESHFHKLSEKTDTYIVDVPISQNDNLPPMYDIYLTKFYRND